MEGKGRWGIRKWELGEGDSRGRCQQLGTNQSWGKTKHSCFGCRFQGGKKSFFIIFFLFFFFAASFSSFILSSLLSAALKQHFEN